MFSSAKDPCEVTDFGTRRRHGFLWQRWCVEALQEGLAESFIGTSNVKHAMDTGLEAIGTNAHELPMVYAAIARNDKEMRAAPYEVLRDWAQMYGGNLLIVLPDCFGTTSFLRNAPDWVADWKGARPDSKQPIEGARELVDWWKARGRDPREKLIVLSDAMDVDSIEVLARALHGKTTLSFGWGTNLTNDFIGCAPAGADGQLRAISLSAKSRRPTDDRQSSCPIIRTRGWARRTKSSATGASFGRRTRVKNQSACLGRRPLCEIAVFRDCLYGSKSTHRRPFAGIVPSLYAMLTPAH